MRTLMLDEVSFVSGGDFTKKLEIGVGLIGALAGGYYVGVMGFVASSTIAIIGATSTNTVLAVAIAGAVGGGFVGGLLGYGIGYGAVAAGSYAINTLAG